MGTRHTTHDTRETVRRIFPVSCVLCLVSLAFFVSMFSGCASTPKTPAAPPETKAEQLDAAQKVVGAMAGGRDMTPADMKRVVKDVRTDGSARSAVQKIIGGAETPVVKYSPVTGKHYSGDLEYDPETGAKLEVIKE